MEHETGVTVLYTNGDTASTRGRRHTVTDPAMHTQRTRAPLETRTNRRGASKAGRPSSQPPSSVSGTWRRVGQDRVPREGARPAAGGAHRRGGTRASRLRLDDAASVSRLEGRGTNGASCSARARCGAHSAAFGLSEHRTHYLPGRRKR